MVSFPIFRSLWQFRWTACTHWMTPTNKEAAGKKNLPLIWFLCLQFREHESLVWWSFNSASCCLHFLCCSWKLQPNGFFFSQPSSSKLTVKNLSQRVNKSSKRSNCVRCGKKKGNKLSLTKVKIYPSLWFFFWGNCK